MFTSLRDAAGHHLGGASRAHRSVTFLTLFAMLFGGLLLLAPSSASAQSTAVVTDYLNLRSGPGTTHAIITTMPTGASVTINGAAEAGFYPVTYNGTAGYASADWLSIGGSAPAVSNGGPTGTAYVHSGALNLRSGPGTGHSILTVMPDGAAVQLTGEQGGGFYGVVYRGMSGYASSDWLTVGSAPSAPAEPDGAPVGDAVVGNATVTAYALNVRSGPSTGNGIVGTVTSGQSIEIMGDPQGGFYPMRANGVTGWVSGDYISLGSGPAPAPAPAPANPGSGSTDIVSIIYAAADAYGQPRADMLRVAQCESVLNPNAVNASSGASGLFQFMPGTWATTPFANEDIFDPVANANAAGWMWSVGRRNEWTCQ